MLVNKRGVAMFSPNEREFSAMHMQSTDEMSFYERTKSFIGHTINQFYWPMNMPVTETQIFREEVDPNFPNLLDLARECPLVRPFRFFAASQA